MGDLGGRSVVLAYGSVAVEYDSLHTNAALFDRSHRGRVRLTGDKASEMVAGLVTNDVSGLIPGQGCYAAALTAKGKIVADVRVFVEEGSVLVDAPPRAAAAWAAMVKKFVNPRLAPHSDQSDALSDLGIFGLNARHIIATLTGVQASGLTVMAPYAHVTIEMDGQRVLLIHGPLRRAQRRPASKRGKLHASKRGARNGASTSMTPPFHRKRTSTNCTRSPTRKAVTLGRRPWPAYTFAGT